MTCRNRGPVAPTCARRLTSLSASFFLSPFFPSQKNIQFPPRAFRPTGPCRTVFYPPVFLSPYSYRFFSPSNNLISDLSFFLFLFESMDDLTESLTPPATATSSRHVPFREDCWTEEATATLVDAWGRRYLELNRGNLRQKDWQEVADAVNARHGHTKKTRRTDAQCKNRIDTLKKKYKIEKGKIDQDVAPVASPWPFFSRLDLLIGSSSNKHPNQKITLPSPPMALPLPFRNPLTSARFTPVILPQKRPMPAPAADEASFRRNYSAMAAAAAATDDEEDIGESEDGSGGRSMGKEEGGKDGLKRLAKAIERFGEIYEKTENMKQRQMVELEKQRMQFAKDLEVQRMRLFMDTQVQLEKLKHAKRSGSSGDMYS